MRAQVNCLNAVLSATRCSRLSIGMLATLQCDWMSCVQRDSGLFSWSRTLSRERSVGACRRACPTHRRRFWRNSANSGGTSVSRRTWSRITCSSGVLATIRHRRRKWVLIYCTTSSSINSPILTLTTYDKKTRTTHDFNGINAVKLFSTAFNEDKT